jgi:hypothetical protein
MLILAEPQNKRILRPLITTWRELASDLELITDFTLREKKVV